MSILTGLAFQGEFNALRLNAKTASVVFQQAAKALILLKELAPGGLAGTNGSDHPE